MDMKRGLLKNSPWEKSSELPFIRSSYEHVM